MAGETFTIVEPLDQGLVTSRDQALLLPGELAKADDSWPFPRAVREPAGLRVALSVVTDCGGASLGTPPTARRSSRP